MKGKNSQQEFEGNGINMKKTNVLVFPGGTVGALEVYGSLCSDKRVEVYGASSAADRGQAVFPKEKYIVGDYHISSPGFNDAFGELLAKYAIDLVIPTHDSVVLYLSQRKALFNAKILCAEASAAAVCREKRKQYDVFSDCPFCPAVFKRTESNLSYPVFIKPNISEGGRGAGIAHNETELKYALGAGNYDYLICEYLPDSEITVDCFTDRKGNLLFTGPRTRERVSDGIAFRSEGIPLTGEIQEIAVEINKRLSMRYAWFFQLKQDQNGKYKLMEISARPSSTMALYRQLGVNFALLSVLDAMGHDLKILCSELPIRLNRCYYNRYDIGLEYTDVYIDFDDTIIVDGRVNCLAMSFLYKALNENKGLHLITQHAFDIYASMGKYRIDKNIFDSIIVLDENDKKSGHIKGEKAIFIDDCFANRDEVRQKLGIPVFDVDAIEVLMYS